MDIATICGIWAFVVVFVLLGFNHLLTKTALWLYSDGWRWSVVELLIRVPLMFFPCGIVGARDSGRMWMRAWMLIYVPNSGFVGEILYLNPETRTCIYKGF